MADKKPKVGKQESPRTITDDQIVTERKLPRRSFLSGTATLLAGGAAALIAGKRAEALSHGPQAQDPDRRTDPDSRKASDPDKPVDRDKGKPGDKDKGRDRDRRRSSDADKRKGDPDKRKTDPDKATDPYR